MKNKNIYSNKKTKQIKFNMWNQVDIFNSIVCLFFLTFKRVSVYVYLADIAKQQNQELSRIK